MLRATSHSHERYVILLEETMNKYLYNDLTIELFDDPTYIFGSTDNKFKYLKHYFVDGGKEFPVSKHAVKILKDDEEINSCIVIASAGATGVQKNSSLIDNDRILICCCDNIFCLSLPDLNLNWNINADQLTCFEIFKFEDDYLIHGELEITRLDKDGKIKWQFGGADIFVTFKGENEFIIYEDHLLLTDWNYTEYKLGFDGKLISSTFNRK